MLQVSGVVMAFINFRAVYRSCIFQIVIVGLVSLCEPGIWTALNNLGAGGQASVSIILDRWFKFHASSLFISFILSLIPRR